MRERVGRVSADGGGSPRTDLISGCVLFVFALAYGFGARGLSASGNPGVALVPIGLAAALALLSAGIALSGWRKLRHPPDRDPYGAGEAASATDDADSEGGTSAVPWATDTAGSRQLLNRPGTARAWTVIGLTIAYAALFQLLGYVLATLLYTAAVAERFGANRRTILVLAPCATLLIFLLFRVILGARLPAGILG